MEPTLFRDMIQTLRVYRSQYVKGFLMLLTSNLLLIVNPLIFRKAIVAESPLFYWVLALVAVAITASTMKYLMRVTFITVSRDVERDVRLKLFERLQNQSHAFYDKYGIGELLSRLTNDISAYRMVLGPGVMYPLFFATLVIPGFAALFYISPQLASFALIPLFIIPLVNASIRHLIYRFSKQVQELLGKLSVLTQEHYTAIRTIKSYAIESTIYRQFTHLCRQLMKSNFWLSILQSIMYPFFSLMTKLVTVALVLLAAVFISHGWGELSTADFISFMWIEAYIFFPMLMLAWLLPVYERGRAAYARLVEIYDEPIEVTDPHESTLRIPSEANIQIKNLTFRYPQAQIDSLQNINLEILPGTILGITGPIGSGKSTLLKLLNRQYEILAGKIFIGNHEIHEYPLEAFSEAIVTVEQMPFLFSKTVAENIRFGKEEATKEELELVSEYADLHQTVLDFPETYDTLVGERGVTLSGGQKQRVAMARAFLVERSVLLLDDIFSAVDTATQKRIFEKMKLHFKGKTVLLVTHRISILDQLERIIYMQNGQIVEDGTPEQLKKQNGRYAALAELQQMIL